MQSKPILLLLYLLTLFSFRLWGQIQLDKPSLYITRTDELILIDGVLDEETWEKAEVTSPFNQRFPADTSLAIYQTEIRMAYNSQFVFVGAICHDNPEGDYVVNSLRRDFDGFGNDFFAVVIDPFLDQVNGFEFAVSPYGAQRESLITNGGNGRDAAATSWDNKWYSKVSRFDDHWVVEMAIPFKTLRYREGVSEWNINFVRNDYKNAERSNWGWIPRNFRHYTLAYTGRLIWDQPLKKPGTNVSLIPYINAGINEDYKESPDKPQTDLGIGGDVKVALGPAMNLDLTVNPDFSQVEVDRQVTNLTRFEVTFPERRQFFLENNDLFAAFGSENVRPFFTRRIGIAKDINTNETVQNQIVGGARLSGKLNKNLRVGALNIQTAEDNKLGIPATNYSVGVLQHQVFKTSNISALFVNKHSWLNEALPDTSELNRFNRVVGLDYNHISPDSRWVGKIFYHHAMLEENTPRPFAHGASMFYNTPGLELRWEHEIVGEGFDAQVGFVRRNNYERIAPSGEIKFYPVSTWLNRYSFEVEHEMLWAEDQGLTDRTTNLSFALRFEGSGFVRVGYENDFVKLLDPFDPTRTESKELATGEAFTTHRFTFFLLSDLRKKFNASARGTMGGFFNGQRYGISGDLNYRIQPIGVFSVNYSVDRVNLPDPYADATLLLVGPKVDIAFSNTVFFSTLVQYNNQIDNMNVNARFQWRFQPASDLFIVYTDNYATNYPFSVKNRGLVVKLTYWLNV